MENLLLLAACFAAGIVLRRSGRLPENAHASVNGFIIHVSLPALVLRHVHGLTPEFTLLYAALMPWAMFGLGVLFFHIFGRLAGLQPATVGGLTLSGSLANTSFVGIPMIEAFYGAAFVGVGVLIDQLGTYMVLSTLGILIAVVYAAGATSPGAVARRVLTFPPFQALLLALLLTPIEYPAVVESIMERLGATLAPLALFSVGYQLRLADLEGRLRALSMGLLFKLVLAPLLMLLLLVKLLGAGGPIGQVTIFEAAMAPQIGAAIVAIENKLDPPLVTLMVGLGIPLSFLTLPVWWYVLQGI
jgi:predicted permease